VRLARSQADSFREILESRFLLAALAQVQLAAVLEGLPQLRAEADALGQQGNGAVATALGGVLAGPLQDGRRVGDGRKAAADDVEIDARDQAEARDLSGAIESPAAEENPAGQGQSAEHDGHGKCRAAPLARLCAVCHGISIPGS